MSSTRHIQKTSTISSSNKALTREYVGNVPNSNVRPTKRRRRLSTPPVDGKAYIGNKTPLSLQVPQRNERVAHPAPSTSAVVLTLDKEEEVLEGGGYIGQRIWRNRPIVEVISSEEDEQEESEPESVQPSPTKRALRKRRIIEADSSDEEETTLVAHTSELNSRASSTPELPEIYYEPEEDEVPEDDDLVVYGETAPDYEDEEEELAPMRLLKNFTIYELTPQCRLVHFNRDLCSPEESRKFGASGSVESYVEPDDDDASETTESEDEDRPVQHISLTEIKEISVHAVCGKGTFTIDPRVYIRTKYAWYILDTPSEDYAPFYSTFSTAQGIFHELITAAREDKQINYKEFVEHLKSLDDIDEDHIEADLQKASTRAYIILSFDHLTQDCRDEHPRICARLLNVPAVAGLVQPPKAKPRAAPLSAPPLRRSPAKSLSPRKPRSTKSRRSAPISRAFSPNVNMKPIAPESTVVTPRVYDLCEELYPENEFLIVGEKTQEKIQLSKAEKRKHPMHANDPNSIEWVEETSTMPNHYRSVIIDGVRYSVGDNVMVEPGEIETPKRVPKFEIRSSNPLAATKWFAKICYMFQDESSTDKHAHIQYYSHGADTILRETAHPYGLFLIDDCISVPLESIYQKFNVREIEPTEDEPEVTAKDNVYLTGLYWDVANTKFFQRKPEEEEYARRRCERYRPCVSCGMNIAQDDIEEWQYQDGALVQRNVEYHVNDFVYIRPELQETDVYVIAQIVDIHESKNVEKKYHTVDLRVYQRCDLILRAETKSQFGEQEMDERRLFRSDTFDDEVDVRSIEGKVYIVHRNSLSSAELDEWTSYDDHFYVDCKAESSKPRSSDDFETLSQRSFKHCVECIDARWDYMREQKRLMETHKPLRGLELFAGAGGLSTGFDESGFVKTLWAVELGASASLTYKANHPYAKVYNQSVNQVLRHAIETYEGDRPEPLHTEGGEKLPLMPQPGEVDFIYGGPPCQGFSRMNHTKTTNDYRNTLVCNMLSYVDFYRPKFFMLENVEGILYHPLAATQTGPGAKMEGGVRTGVVKFILRVLISLGYQAHFKLLQAGQYGAPQSRLRVIFLGAKRDIPLPMFPIPTHCTADDAQHVTFEGGILLRPVVRVIPTENKDIETRRSWLQFAPLLRVSVEDAISDLPKFDWINPCEIITEPEDTYEITQRLRHGIRRFGAVYDKATNDTPYSGWREPEPYTSAPLSSYQKWMRKSMKGKGVTYQYTQRYRASVVECVVNVPLKEDANHSDLPEPLRNPVWFEDGKIYGKSKSSYNTIYGRVHGKWHFQTALTSANPNAKGGRLLHPTQKRVLTIREFARAQGFPDHQEFLSTENNPLPDQIRQIGNAVPVPLASALGKSIGSVLTSMWAEEDEQAEREFSPEIPMDLD